MNNGKRGRTFSPRLIAWPKSTRREGRHESELETDRARTSRGLAPDARTRDRKGAIAFLNHLLLQPRRLEDDMLQEMGSNLASKSVLLLTAGLAICAGLSLSVAQTQISAPKLGDAAPEIKLAKLLQAPDGAATDWKSLKGKVVVVEFW